MNNKKGFLVLTFLFLASHGIAQWNTGGDIDKQRVSLGFILGVDASNYVAVKKSNFQNYNIQSTVYPSTATSTRLQSITSSYAPGFHLGILTALRITDNLDLLFLPDINFTGGILKYAYDSLATIGGSSVTSPITKNVETTFLDFPLVLKFKSDRKRTIRSYIVGGLVYSRDNVPKNKTDDTGLDAP